MSASNFETVWQFIVKVNATKKEMDWNAAEAQSGKISH